MPMANKSSFDFFSPLDGVLAIVCIFVFYIFL